MKYDFKLDERRELQIVYSFQPSEEETNFGAQVDIINIRYKGRSVLNQLSEEWNKSVWEDITNEILEYEGEGAI